MIQCQRSSREWFAEAARCYIEQHQGCAWCGESYCVFHNRRGSRSEYCCNGCDFWAIFDAASDRYSSFPGDTAQIQKPDTMFEI